MDSTCHSYNLSDIGALKRRIRIVVRMPISFVMSVPPSLRMYQRGIHWKDLGEIWYCGLSLRNCREHFFFFSCENVSGTLHEDLQCVTGVGDIQSPGQRALRVKWY